MRMTIDEVARLAGVSKTTVSRVLNNKPDVKPQTREMIMRIISQYDFQPNAFAKAISLRKSYTIGLVIPYSAEYIFSNLFYAEVMRGVSTETSRRGYHLLLCYTGNDKYLDMFKQKLVEAFIVISPGSTHKGITRKLAEIEAPFVTTSKMPGAGDIRYVDIDNIYGSTLAMEHLISMGHRRIGLIIGSPILTSSEERLEGYSAVLKKYGIPFDSNLVRRGDGSIESGYEAMLELLGEELTAVFVTCDTMAMGAVRAIKEKGKKVPDDISLVGFDDIPVAQIMDPPLTTVKQPAYQKGKCAAKMLIDLIEGKEVMDKCILPVEIALRESTRKI